jgi:hypothetical protein
VSSLQGVEGHHREAPAQGEKAAQGHQVGDKIPAITIDEGFNPIGKVDMAEACKGKKIVILGLPGAFTPC